MGQLYNDCMHGECSGPGWNERRVVDGKVYQVRVLKGCSPTDIQCFPVLDRTDPGTQAYGEATSNAFVKFASRVLTVAGILTPAGPAAIYSTFGTTLDVANTAYTGDPKNMIPTAVGAVVGARAKALGVGPEFEKNAGAIAGQIVNEMQ